MKTNSSQDIPWGRLFAEGVAIVLSILLAFWIDAWWETAQQRERERIVLHALLDDLVSIRQRVDNQRKYNEAMLDATTSLLQASVSGRDLEQDYMDALLRDVVWYNAPSTWYSATMDLLVSAGDLAALSNAELVTALASLHDRLGSAANRSEIDEVFYRETLIPFLRKRASLPQILSGIEHAPGMPDWLYDFPELEIAVRRDHRDLLRDSEFQGLLAAKIDIVHDILQYSLGNLGDDLDQVIVILQSELGE
jgi:hypothetical protein